MLSSQRITCTAILLAINIAIAASLLDPHPLSYDAQVAVTNCTCNNNATLVFNRHCLHRGMPSEWAPALERCTELGSSIMLIETMKTLRERQSLYNLLRQWGVSEVWIEVRKSKDRGPITYQLPASEMFHKPLEKKISEAMKGGSPTSLDIPWTSKSLLDSHECLTLVASEEYGQLRLQKDDCSRRLPFFCVTEPSVDKVPLPKPVGNPPTCNGTEIRASRRPSLELRIGAMDAVFLDVYNSETVLNSSFLEPFSNVKNPECSLDGTALYSSERPQTEFQENIVWPRARGELEYFITKAVFKIIFEGQGYLSCMAHVAGCGMRITAERLLVRIPNELTFSLAMRYNSSHCKGVGCNPRQKGFLMQVSASLRRDFPDSYSVNPVRVTDGMESTAIIFHVMMHSDPALGHEAEMLTDGNLTRRLYETVEQHIRNGRTPGLDAVLHVRSTMFCHRDLEWPATEMGNTAVPGSSCTTGGGVPVTRKCLGDFIEGAYWEVANNSVCEETSSRANILRQLSARSAVLDAQNILSELDSALNPKQTTDHHVQLAPVEIQSIAVTLANLQTTNLNVSDIPKIANITNAVMMMSRNESKKDYNSLRIAQNNMNTSNSILESLDNLLYRVNLTTNKGFVVTETFATLVVDVPNSVCGKKYPGTGLRGLAVLRDSVRNHFRPEDIVQLAWSDTLESVLQMNVSVATILPDTLVLGSRSSIDNWSASEYRKIGCGESGSSRPRRLVVSLFWDDSLFGSSDTYGPPSHVLSVALDGRRQTLDDPLVLLFDRPHETWQQNNSQGEVQEPCVFWDFAVHDRRGQWRNTGCSLATTAGDLSSSAVTVDICVCTHLTHFGELIPNPYSASTNFGLSIAQASDTKFLDTISLVGCSLSILGLLGIFSTAAVFPEWRRGTGKKLQLHLSGACLLLMVTFLYVIVFGNPQHDSETAATLRCTTVGFLLNYSVFSVFLWMLMMAWFQYQRLTRPLESLSHTPHYLLWAGVVAWGLPAIPCCTSAAMGLYRPPSCYPQGAASLLITIPVGVIIVINIAIFVLILWSIFGCRRCIIQLQTDCQLRNSQCERQRIIRRVVVSIYLFSLLGMCWVFGYFRWSLLFCATATLQGLSFFIFFVVLDEATRGKWYRYMQRSHLKVTSAIANSRSSEEFTRKKSRLSAQVSAFVEDK